MSVTLACKDCGTTFEAKSHRNYCEACIVNHPASLRNRAAYEKRKQARDSLPSRPKLPCGHFVSFLVEDGCAACFVLAAHKARLGRGDPLSLTGSRPAKKKRSEV